ncbi:hypothetical protein [Geobacter sp. DSM 9736]|uniref:hypothetical protein n=1 Tax=Geobacter sp. DSM 9736 TaxID=1277350 RepID=UPI000B5109B1|nr:hypothetical protein [Geobacter sp. DSM 9736]SNB45220.1 hypothetical protein SAMN06269301_0623 [Geobacter sp. DSM 9736]
MKLTGAPKQVEWAEKVRKDRLKVWHETSPEVFKAIEPILALETRAEWWIAHKDKGLEVVCNQLLSGKGQGAGQGKRIK